MNCLLLLLILFCCGQGNCTTGGRQGCRKCSVSSGKEGCDNHFGISNTGEGCCQTHVERQSDCGCMRETERKSDCGYKVEMERESSHIGRIEVERENSCECRLEREVGTTRPHYPYLELEPRTCGCEENSNRK